MSQKEQSNLDEHDQLESSFPNKKKATENSSKRKVFERIHFWGFPAESMKPHHKSPQKNPRSLFTFSSSTGWDLREAKRKRRRREQQRTEEKATRRLIERSLSIVWSVRIRSLDWWWLWERIGKREMKRLIYKK